MLSKKSADKFSRYVDPTGELPNQELKLAKWYLKHKILLGQIGVDLLVAFIVVTGGYSLIAWGSYLIFGYQQDELNRANLVRNYVSVNKIRSNFSPNPFTVGDVRVFNSATGKYDFVVEAVNPNPTWLVDIFYKFTYSGGETTETVARVLPGSKMILAGLGQAVDGFPENPTLVIQNTAWNRVDPHKFSDPIAYLKERINFIISDFDFIPAGGSNDVPTHAIIFKLTNNSPYSYWQPEFFVLYKDGDNPVGLKRIIVDKFRANETRAVELKSLAEQLSVSGVEVIPVMDVFDQEAFIPIGQ